MSWRLERYVEGSCTAKLSFVPPGHRRAGCGLIDVLTSVMLLAKAQLCIAVSELFSAAVIVLVSCSCAWTGEILSCRRMERALIGLRIPFWLKIAVVFGTALCVRAEGIQPGCFAIGIISEEAKPLSSDYVCSLSSYCCRDGSFEDFGYGSAACSQSNSIQDYEPGRYPGVSTPLRRCYARPFGVARREALIKSTKQCFSGGGSHVALVCRCSYGPARNDLWSTYPIPTMGWCDKSIFGCEHSFGAKPMDKPAASSLCTENVGVCLFGYEICRPCSGQLWPCGMLAVAESSLCVGVLSSTDLDSVEEGAPAKRRRLSSVGVITDEIQKRLMERLSKGYLGAYLWESGIRGQDVENCLKAERRSGVAVLAISALQNCMRVCLKIDEVRAMRQHFPMNLHGKQIGHVLGYIPGSLYGQAVLQGMSRAYQGVLEEANWRIVEFRLRATTPASSAMPPHPPPLPPPAEAPPNLLAVAQSKAVPPASGGFDMGLTPPTPPAFNTPERRLLY